MNTAMNYELLCREVVRISREVGEYLLKEQPRVREQHLEFKGSNDLVTYVDKQAEVAFVDALSKLLPAAGFIAEEGTSDRRSEFYNWVIDPLDGTTNYLHGIPMYCTSIGLLLENEPILGVIYDPTHDACFYGWKDGGAFLNGGLIHVKPTRELSQTLMVMGFPYDTKGRLDSYLQIVKSLTLQTRGIRRLGSAALDMAYVACGRFDAFFEYGLHPWDVAAGALLVSEAGGLVTDWSGEKAFISRRELLCANPAIHAESLKIIRKNW